MSEDISAYNTAITVTTADGRIIKKLTCPKCGETKAKQAFAATGNYGEDLTLCRGCRDADKRAKNRRRVASEADANMTDLLRPTVAAARAKKVAAEVVPASIITPAIVTSITPEKSPPPAEGPRYPIMHAIL